MRETQRPHSRPSYPLAIISGAAYAALPQKVNALPSGIRSSPVLANEKSTRIA